MSQNCRVGLPPCHFAVSENAARLNTCVDYPELLLWGLAEESSRNACTIFIAWMAMGSQLASHKASLSEDEGTRHD